MTAMAVLSSKSETEYCVEKNILKGKITKHTKKNNIPKV